MNFEKLLLVPASKVALVLTKEEEPADKAAGISKKLSGIAKVYEILC